MKYRPLALAALITFLAVCSIPLFAGGSHPTQVEQPDTLLKYIDTLKWDASKKGPLLAIEPAQVHIATFVEPGTEPTEPPERLGKKLVKVGQVSVFAPTTSYRPQPMTSKEESAPLEVGLKIVALIAQLSDSEFERLNQKGLCANDLTGDARMALLTLIPKQIDLHEELPDGNLKPGSYRVLSDSERLNVKFQFCRHVALTLLKKENGSTVGNGLRFSSLEAGAPPDLPLLHSHALDTDRPSSDVPEELVKATEKEYGFDWQHTGLSKLLNLKEDESIGELVDRIRNRTNLEIYADARIAQFKVYSIGTSSDCGSVLHALVLAVDGVIRPVGNAFIVTENLEGEATTAARLVGQQFLAHHRIEPLVTKWIRKVKARGLFSRLAFVKEDQVALAAFPNGFPKNKELTSHDCPLTSLPQAAQAHARQIISDRSETDTDHSAKYDRAQVSDETCARWIFPNGQIILEWPTETIPGLNQDIQSPEDSPPLDASKFQPGSAVEIYPKDSATASSMVKALIACGFKDVWVDSTDPSVIEAATRSGDGHVDLVIRPWRPIKNEPLPTPDLNALGQTGSKVASLPPGTLDRTFDFHIFSNTFTPGDPHLGRHWSNLLSLIPKSGIHRVIVLDPYPGGYGPPPSNEIFGSARPLFEDGRLSYGFLVHQDPAANDFGYTLESRLRFIREHHLDPLDLKYPVPSPGTFMIGDTDFPQGSLFHGGKDADRYLKLWRSERRQEASDALSRFTVRFKSLPYEVCQQLPFTDNQFPTGPQVPVKVRGRTFKVDWVAVGPGYSEDGGGRLVEMLDPDEYAIDSVCIDFRVPANDFDRYIKHYFTRPNATPRQSR